MAIAYYCFKVTDVGGTWLNSYLYLPAEYTLKQTKLLSCSDWTKLATSANELVEYTYTNTDYPDWNGPVYPLSVDDATGFPGTAGPIVDGKEIEVYNLEWYDVGDLEQGAEPAKSSSFKIGTQEVKRIYLKDYEVQKIYLGTMLMFQTKTV